MITNLGFVARITDSEFVDGYMGKYLYMSPDMAIRERSSFETSLYSLGIIYNQLMLNNTYGEIWETFFDKFKTIVRKDDFQIIHKKIFKILKDSEIGQLIVSDELQHDLMVI